MRFILIVSVLFAVSCKQVVVRDPDVYKAELDFIDSAADEQVQRGKALIEVMCKCVEVEGVKAFETRQCHDLAETVLVVEARIGYHTDFMRYLGGLSDTRSPVDPPEIAEPTTLCPVVK